MSKAVAPQPPARGTRGRPADPRKNEQIKVAAGKLFMRQGVQGTTMDQIAAEAGVSKLTLYRKYPDKNALFMDVVGGKCEEYMPASLFDLAKGNNAATVLNRVGCALLGLATSADGVNLYRVLTAEAPHNPNLAKQFFETGPKRVKTCMHDLMAALAEQKVLDANPDEATEFFSALIMGSELQKHAVIGVGPQPTAAGIKAYVQRAVDFFLRAYKA